MTAYDLIAEADSDDECRLWVRKLINARDDVVAFVDSRLDGQGSGKCLGFLKGSFNLSFHIGFGEGKPNVLIRFAKPGHTFSAWRDEKVTNEVRVIEYLREHTTIPLPHVRCWGLAEEIPAQLGPFIIMDFIEGVRLSTFLKEPSEDDQADLILNSAVDEATLDTIYDQLADYLLQISRLEFSYIGVISKDVGSGTWSVTGRALTFNMNELATNTGYPADQFPNAPFACTSLDVEDIYWAALHDHKIDGDGMGLLDTAARAELEELVKLKMEQRQAYNEAYDLRFPDDEDSD